MESHSTITRWEFPYEMVDDTSQRNRKQNAIRLPLETAGNKSMDMLSQLFLHLILFRILF